MSAANQEERKEIFGEDEVFEFFFMYDYILQIIGISYKCSKISYLNISPITTKKSSNMCFDYLMNFVRT